MQGMHEKSVSHKRIQEPSLQKVGVPILKNLAFFKNESSSTKIGVQDCQSAVSESSDDAMFLLFFVSSQLMGAQWVSGRVLELRLWGRGFEPHRCHCIMSLSKNINPGLVLFQPRKIHL